ncbi:MAG: serine hydrolase domain-containing protein [Clostridia bacterium]|nr:serine hydrolase domain-containing protein [Clostridia bacterium]
MPTGWLKNAAYRLALPLLAPSPRGKITMEHTGVQLTHLQDYQRILTKHHVLGSSLLMRQGDQEAQVYVSVGGNIQHTAQADTLYRVASITKMATALTILRLWEADALSLDAPVCQYLPDSQGIAALQDVTIRQLLCHTSGLRDVPAYQYALDHGQTYQEVLQVQGIRGSHPGEQFAYCNLGFGLLGCVMEQVTGESLAQVMQEMVFRPLGMEATMDASSLPEERIMPIRRVVQRGKSRDVRITPLGKKPLTTPDPLRHFGHTAGAMYTTCESMSKLLAFLQQEGAAENRQIMHPETLRMMMSPQASYGQLSPGMDYGLGLIRFTLPELPDMPIMGHQGFAYGCVDGAFFTQNRQVIFLNGGASELRIGRLGVVNRDVLHYALMKEMPAWT